LEREKGLRFEDYDTLWQWSVDQLESFWESVWQYFDVQSSAPATAVLESRNMPGARWFPGARINFSQQLFRFNHGADGDRPAIISLSELRGTQTMSWQALRDNVTRAAASLRKMGVGPGDRVVGYLPNTPEATIAFYACASIGAVWSSCSPDMGAAS